MMILVLVWSMWMTELMSFLNLPMLEGRRLLMMSDDAGCRLSRVDYYYIQLFNIEYEGWALFQ